MSYQHFRFDGDGSIHLSGHTLLKLGVACDAVRSAEPHGVVRVADVGCAEGAIGIAVAQAFPNALVTLINGSADEKDEVERALLSCSSSLRGRLDFLQAWAQDLPGDASYDVTLWFAVAHHLLDALGSDALLNLLGRLTRCVAVVEVPVGDDALLKLWKARHGAQHYRVLASVETAVAWLGQRFSVTSSRPIEYGEMSTDLSRHAIVCRVR
jgi:hypothetical protein